MRHQHSPATFLNKRNRGHDVHPHRMVSSAENPPAKNLHSPLTELPLPGQPKRWSNRQHDEAMALRRRRGHR